MIADFADLCTYVYVLTDEAYREVAASHDTWAGPGAAFTDSEPITLTLATELVGIAAETRFLAYVRRNHQTLFPLFPSARATTVTFVNFSRSPTASVGRS